MDSSKLGVTCSVDECAEPVKRLALCYGHYMKQWRYGTPTPQHPSRAEDVTDQRFGSLVAMRHHGKGKWLCRCDCGTEVLKALAADLKRPINPTCGSNLCRRWSESYVAVHGRLSFDRGPAAAYACVDCCGPALHWSYDHSDPDELYATEERIVGIAYSLNPEHYAPRCVPCHKRHDLDRLNSTPHD